MKDFLYFNPCKLIFGRNTSDSLAGELLPLGKKVLLVYGQRSIKETGLYDRIRGQLEAAGVEITEHGGVKSNPVLSHVRAGVELAKEHGVEFVLAVGGGSVIDEAKAIAMGAVTERDVWSFFAGRIRPDGALPVVVVLTIAATGSESNGASVITNEQTQEKLGMSAWCLIPLLSIMDPLLTLTLTGRYVAYSFADTMSHVVEGYFNGEAVFLTVQDELSEGLMRSIIRISEDVIREPDNYEYRAEAMWAATVAHNGMLRAGRGRVVFEIHTVAHALGALYDMPHGAAISVVMPAWMIAKGVCCKEKMRRFAKNVFGITQTDEDNPAHTAALCLKQWLSGIGAPISLTETGIDKRAIIDKLRLPGGGWGISDVTDEDIHRLVESMF